MNIGPLRVPQYPKTIGSSSTATGTVYSGVQMAEAVGFGEWDFQLIGTFTNQTVTIYGTLDPAAVNQSAPGKYQPNTSYPNPGSTGGNWFPLVAPSSESTGDTYQFINPLTAVNQILHYKGGLVAVCAGMVGASATGTVYVLAWAID